VKTQIISATKIINAPAEKIYRIIADYQSNHPRILPKAYFISLEVEGGGYGEGTIIRYQMRILGRVVAFRALITEPDPGCTLVETDLASHTSTSFTVWSLGNRDHARVTIMTVLPKRGLIGGFLAKLFLTHVYRQELELLAKFATRSTESVQATPTDHHVHTATSK